MNALLKIGKPQKQKHLDILSPLAKTTVLCAGFEYLGWQEMVIMIVTVVVLKIFATLVSK